ncbi:lamin tail domain-containing protein [Kribbella sp.]|uniref:lamin tail domain-containing protein n=1 Tax=Kribbella sp. TaxID=1871183 RepID=UPI002D2EFB4F|nr:lamin tail domain-containing protein [Kribbella sp.]HZX06804.1 lamin tail domain-containing protein [Kribbella sp.]
MAVLATAGVAVAAAAVAPLPASAVSPVLFTGIQYDPPGPDYRTNAQLNREYVVVRNNSTRSVTLAGWRIRDAQNHTFVFPRGFVLRGRTSVVVHTGRGRNTSVNLYWGSGNYIWNNTGDTARLQTPANRTVDTCSYRQVSGRARVAC